MPPPQLLYRLCAHALVTLLFVTSSLAAQAIHTCTVMPGELPAVENTTTAPRLPGAVQKAVSYKPLRSRSPIWKAGSTLSVRFIGGSNTLRNRVMRYAKEWTRYANLNFRVVPFGKADIRVAFSQDGSSWSVIGRASAFGDQQRPSMNFGWLTDRTPEAEVRRTVLHEFGHAIGLLHEHQNPAGGIPWDHDAVYTHYQRTQGWDRQTTYDNVMATARQDVTQYSTYDAASIMHYPVSPKLTGGRYSVGMNNGLSVTDKRYIATLYPGREPVTTSRPTNPTATRPQTGRPTTTTTRPRPTTTTKPRPVAARHDVSIANSLGKNQRAETVELYVANKKYMIRLDRNGRQRQQINLDLPRGQYRYRVVTNSTYQGYRTIRRNGRAYRRAVNYRVPGEGSGVLTVDRNLALTLYGDYDKQRRRNKLYLGQSK